MKNKTIKIDGTEYIVNVNQAIKDGYLKPVGITDLNVGDVFQHRSKWRDEADGTKIVVVRNFDGRWYCLGLRDDLKPFSNSDDTGPAGYSKQALINYLNNCTYRWELAGNINDKFSAALKTINLK